MRTIPFSETSRGRTQRRRRLNTDALAERRIARDILEKTTHHLVDPTVLLRCCLFRRLLIMSIRLLASSSSEEAQQPLKQSHRGREEGDDGPSNGR
jgi:hypothetical protein